MRLIVFTKYYLVFFGYLVQDEGKQLERGDVTQNRFLENEKQTTSTWKPDNGNKKMEIFIQESK